MSKAQVLYTKYVCNRCQHEAQVRTKEAEACWAHIDLFFEDNSDAMAVTNPGRDPIHLCPRCVEQFNAWWSLPRSLRDEAAAVATQREDQQEANRTSVTTWPSIRGQPQNREETP